MSVLHRLAVKSLFSLPSLFSGSRNVLFFPWCLDLAGPIKKNEKSTRKACYGNGKRIGWPSSARWIILLAGIQFSFFIHAQGPGAQDSLIALLKTAAQDTSRANALSLLAHLKIIGGELDTAKKLAQEGIELSKKIGFAKGEAKSHTNLGNAFLYENNFPGALSCHLLALKIFSRLGNKKGLAMAHNNIGNIYKYQGSTPKALESYIASLKLYEVLQDSRGMAAALGNLGSIHFNIGNFEEAMNCYRSSLEIHEKSGDKKGIAISFNNIGNVYKMQGQYDQALESYLASLNIKKTLGDKKGMADSYNNIGNICADKGDRARALEYFFSSLKIKEEFNDRQGMATSLCNIAIVLYETKDFWRAQQYGIKALSLAEEIGALYEKGEANKVLSDVYAEKGDYKKALSHYKEFVTVRDSMINEGNTKKQVQVQMQYEFDKKIVADSIRNTEARKLEDLRHSQEISRQRTFTIGGVAGFLVMIIVAGVSYTAFRNKKKANQEIALQKTLVEAKQKEILDSIYYARRIQRALITSEKYMERALEHLKRFDRAF